MPIVNMDKEEAMNVEATFPDVSDSRFIRNLLFTLPRQFWSELRQYMQ
jgi:hypothetical protein